jgi:hypothetical protein
MEYDKVKPLVDEAKSVIAKISKDDITFVKNIKVPPEYVMVVMECILVYFKESKLDWASAQKMMSNNFLNNIKDYKINKIDKNVLTKVRKLMNDKKRWDMVKIKGASEAAHGLAIWCKAILRYADAKKKLDPLEEECNKMQAQVDQSQQQLNIKKEQLRQIAESITQMKKKQRETQETIEKLNSDKV